MRLSFLNFWILFALTSTSLKVFVDALSTFDSASACKIDLSGAQKGFKVKYYDYYYNDQAIETASYLASGYTTLPLISTANGVTDLHYSLGHSGVYVASTATTNIWGMSVRYSEYVFEFTGYYYPLVTGLYEFVIDFVDDTVIFYVGYGSFDCCTGENIPDDADATYILFTKWTSDFNPSSNSALVYLEEGYYIPLRIVQGNLGTTGGLQFEVYKPDGTVDPNFYDNVVAPIPAADCTATTISAHLSTTTITSGTEEPYTVTSTYTDANGTPTITKVVVVDPTPSLSTTTITLPTCDEVLTTTSDDLCVVFPHLPVCQTSTSSVLTTEAVLNTLTDCIDEPSTTTSTYTNTNGDPTSTGVIVLVPTSELGTTTITSGTEEPYTVTSTYTDSNGVPTSTGVVVVDPTLSLSTTTITLPTCDEVLTTTSDDLCVVFPHLPVCQTSTSSVLTTEAVLNTLTDCIDEPSTTTSTYTNTNGDPTSTGVIVLVPTSELGTTTITSGTEEPYTVTSTYTDSNGVPTSTGVLVINPTPSLDTITITSGTEEPYTVTSTYTDSNGVPTSTGVVVINPTPSLDTITITSGTEEPYTVTSTYTDSNGVPTSTGVVVINPTPSLDTITITSGTEEPYTVTSTYTDSNGVPTSTGVVVINPTPSLDTITITSGTEEPYTVTSTYTDSNGVPTSTGVVVINPTPSMSTTTITSGTEEPYTVTSTYTDSNGVPTSTGVVVVGPTFGTLTIISGNDVPTTVISTLTIGKTITTCFVVMSPSHDDFTTVTIRSGATPIFSSATFTGSNGKLTTGVTLVKPSTEQIGLTETTTETNIEVGATSTQVLSSGHTFTSASAAPKSNSTDIPQDEFNAANINYSVIHPFTYLIPFVLLVIF